MKQLIFALLFFPFLASQAMNNPFQNLFAGKKENKKTRSNPLIEKNYDELIKGKEKALSKKDIPAAIKHLDALRIVCTDTNQAKDFLMELADLYVQQEEWTKAEKAYLEFILLNPGAVNCDLAYYKAIETGFKLTSTIDRDQTKTQEILERTQKFFTAHSQSSYKEVVQKIQNDCKQKLFDHDEYVFQFYLKSKNYKAANARLARMVDDHKPTFPDCEPNLLQLTFQLADAQNNQTKALQTQIELHQKFPDHLITKQLVADIEPIKIQLAALEESASISLPKAEPITIAKR